MRRQLGTRPKLSGNLLEVGSVLCFALALHLFAESVRRDVENEASEQADAAWEKVTDKASSGTSTISE
jgi:hypothetical protein